MAPSPSTTLKGVFLCLLVLLTFLCNAFVFVILVKKERRLLKRPLYLFILSICASDLITCVFTMTFEVSEEISHRWFYSEIGCKIIECLEISLFGVNIFSHLSIALERYRNVVHPLKPPMRIRTAKKLVVGAWCFPSVMALPYLYTYHVIQEDGDDICMALSWPWLWLDKLFGTVELLAVFLVPLVCLFSMYFVIIKTLYLRSRLPSNNINVGTSHAGSTVRAAASRGSRVSILVVSVFVICWIPYIVMSLVRLLTSQDDVNRTSQLYVVALYFSFTNELLSPVIYCGFDRNIRPTLLRLLVRCKLRHRVMVGADMAANDPDRTADNTSRIETLDNRAEGVLNDPATSRQNVS